MFSYSGRLTNVGRIIAKDTSMVDWRVLLFTSIVIFFILICCCIIHLLKRLYRYLGWIDARGRPLDRPVRPVRAPKYVPYGPPPAYAPPPPPIFTGQEEEPAQAASGQAGMVTFEFGPNGAARVHYVAGRSTEGSGQGPSGQAGGEVPFLQLHQVRHQSGNPHQAGNPLQAGNPHQASNTLQAGNNMPPLVERVRPPKPPEQRMRAT